MVGLERFGWLLVAVLFISAACSSKAKEPASKTSNRVIMHPALDMLERRALKWEQFSINIDIPINFTRDWYGSYSFTDKMILRDPSEHIFFTFDGFMEDEVAEYRYYYGDDVSVSTADLSHAEFMLRYAILKRRRNLLNPTVSQLLQTKSERGVQFYIQSIYGKESTYNDELFFYYCAVSKNDHTILAQAVFSIQNLKFVFTDIRDIFSSIYINN
jgi:hypothetical protein